MLLFRLIISFFIVVVFFILGLALSGCVDGWGSSSIGLRGACSHHGGVSRLPVILNMIGIAISVFLFFWLPDFFGKRKSNELADRQANNSNSNGNSNSNSNGNSNSNSNSSNNNNKDSNDSLISESSNLPDKKNFQSQSLKKELIASIEKNRVKENVKLFFYSDGLLICETAKSNENPIIVTGKINRKNFKELMLAFNELSLTCSQIEDLKNKYIRISIYSDDAKNKEIFFMKSFNNLVGAKIKMIITESISISSSRL
ncbi:hypothetical protein [Pectobacterium parmentieri]|uniref:hypothetical protein n=1 Tax=Pectobacterium parmentieri TaxID=1905730 RepID=UPI0013C4C7BB|nr:hypothetical protein [Pectobacterium parmentieri]